MILVHQYASLGKWNLTYQDGFHNFLWKTVIRFWLRRGSVVRNCGNIHLLGRKTVAYYRTMTLIEIERKTQGWNCQWEEKECRCMGYVKYGWGKWRWKNMVWLLWKWNDVFNCLTSLLLGHTDKTSDNNNIKTLCCLLLTVTMVNYYNLQGLLCCFNVSDKWNLLVLRLMKR